AIPDAFLETELFGQGSGAPNGAAPHKGWLEQAQGGTLFLDAVADLPGPLQVRLLRVLEDRQIDRGSATEPVKLDVRVIAASNRNLAFEVRRAKFRSDLCNYLSAVRIEVPPLRERLEDLPLLVTHFAQKYTRPGERPRPFSPAAMDALLQNP